MKFATIVALSAAAVAVASGCTTDDDCASSIWTTCQSNGQCAECVDPSPYTSANSSTCITKYGSAKPYCYSGECSPCKEWPLVAKKRTADIGSTCPHTAPYCSTMDGCGKCTSGSSMLCSRTFDDYGACDSDSGACVACVHTESSIPCGVGYQCLQNNTCAPCSPVGEINAACQEWYGDEVYCVAGPDCAACVGSKGCTANSPVCTDGTCGSCTVAGQCTQYSGHPICSSGRCVECGNSDDCPLAKPICNSGTCAACANSEECGGGRTCVTTLGAIPVGYCVECTGSECDTLYPGQDMVCDMTSGRCSDCLGGTDLECTSLSKGQCKNGRCSPCTASAACAGKTDPADNDHPMMEVCKAGSCTKCDSNTDCLEFDAHPRCDMGNGPTKGACIPCSADSDCEGHGDKIYCNKDGDDPVCSASKGTGKSSGGKGNKGDSQAGTAAALSVSAFAVVAAAAVAAF